MSLKIFTLTLVLTISTAIYPPNEHILNHAEKVINPLHPPPLSSKLSENNQRIINGNEAKPNSRMYQAGLIIRRLRNGFETSHVCGGSILSKNTILTTGFCIENSHTIIVVLGAHYLFDENEVTQQRFTLTPNDYIFHPEYSSSCMCNDIALLRLPIEATFNNFVQLIDLPSDATLGKKFVGETVEVAGKIIFGDEF